VFEVRREGEHFAARTIWENSRMKNKFTSSLLHEGYLYGLDESILACIDAATGELKWKGGRYGYGQPIIAGGHLVVLTEAGDLVLVRATPQRHDELARFSAIDGKTWNHPVIADGRLLVRNLREMAAFDIRPR
jgi:outer membrane protein assembly factor BamB